MSKLPVIRTERILLRELELEDLDAVHSYLSDPDVLKYMVHDVTTKEQSLDYLQRFLYFQKEEPRKYFRFAVIVKTDGKLIGECGLNVPNPINQEGEIVYRFTKDYWGKGYARESVKKVIEFGFNNLSLHRIEAMCDSRNLASINVLQKSGMIFEGCLREHRWIKEEWRSSVIYSILSTDFHNKA